VFGRFTFLSLAIPGCRDTGLEAAGQFIAAKKQSLGIPRHLAASTSDNMNDLIFVAAMVLFFVVSAVYVRFCDKL